jgi:hypothetical protein
MKLVMPEVFVVITLMLYLDAKAVTVQLRNNSSPLIVCGFEFAEVLSQ